MAEFYAMKHKVTGRVYVGHATSAENRIKQHIDALKRGAHHNKWMQEDCDKNGILFDFYLLEKGSYWNEYKREHEYQAMLRSTDEATGYNLAYKSDHKITISDFTPLLITRGRTTERGKKGEEYI